MFRALPGAAVLALALGAGVLAAQVTTQTTQTPPAGQRPDITPATPVPPANSPGREVFAGVWQYSPEDSVNATTGRPETAAGRRTAAGNSGGGSARPRPTPVGPTGGTAGGAGGGTSSGSGAVTGGGPGDPWTGSGGGGWAVGGGGFGPALMATELRDTERDLVEIPLQLTIAFVPDGVSFTDDLKRERTYPIDARKKDYMLGAARYQARVRWDGPQLIKEIEAPHGFKMTETYFLSSDGGRMFVVIRLSPPRKDGKPNGFNRVYDRVQ